MEPLLRSIRAKRDKTSYKLVGGMKLQMMVYADDICVTASTPEALQETLSVAGDAAKECGLTFKPAKCATLHMNCQKGRRVQPSVFSIQGGSPKVLKEGEAYRHLGIPSGYRVAQTPTEAINQMIDDLNAIDESALAPWQKIDAVSTFINPRIEFIARGRFVFKTLLYPIDKLTKKLAKRWLHLPQRASAEVIYLLPSQGGAGLLPLVDGVNNATVTQAYRMLTCNDGFVRQVAWSCLKTVARRKTGIKNPTERELADYLNSNHAGVPEREGGDIRSIWTRTRKATTELRKHSNGPSVRSPPQPECLSVPDKIKARQMAPYRG